MTAFIVVLYFSTGMLVESTAQFARRDECEIAAALTESRYAILRQVDKTYADMPALAYAACKEVPGVSTARRK